MTVLELCPRCSENDAPRYGRDLFCFACFVALPRCWLMNSPERHSHRPHMHVSSCCRCRICMCMVLYATAEIPPGRICLCLVLVATAGGWSGGVGRCYRCGRCYLLSLLSQVACQVELVQGDLCRPLQQRLAGCIDLLVCGHTHTHTHTHTPMHRRVQKGTCTYTNTCVDLLVCALFVHVEHPMCVCMCLFMSMCTCGLALGERGLCVCVIAAVQSTLCAHSLCVSVCVYMCVCHRSCSIHPMCPHLTMNGHRLQHTQMWHLPGQGAMQAGASLTVSYLRRVRTHTHTHAAGKVHIQAGASLTDSCLRRVWAHNRSHTHTHTHTHRTIDSSSLHTA